MQIYVHICTGDCGADDDDDNVNDDDSTVAHLLLVCQVQPHKAASTSILISLSPSAVPQSQSPTC
jgi:hypothetical protein